jgi:hypothetical protein
MSPLTRLYENEFSRAALSLFSIMAQKKAGLGKFISFDKVLDCTWTSAHIRRVIALRYFFSFRFWLVSTWGYIGFGIWIETRTRGCVALTRELPGWRYFPSSIY